MRKDPFDEWLPGMLAQNGYRFLGYDPHATGYELWSTPLDADPYVSAIIAEKPAGQGWVPDLTDPLTLLARTMRPTAAVLDRLARRQRDASEVPPDFEHGEHHPTEGRVLPFQTPEPDNG